MDKKKVLTVLSVLGLSGGLMFSVSALSADTLVDSGSASLPGVPAVITPMAVDCTTNPGNPRVCAY